MCVRCGEAGAPPPEAQHPRRRGHQLGRRHLHNEDEPTRRLLRPLRPHRPGRRPRGQEQQTGARLLPGLRPQVQPPGRSREGDVVFLSHLYVHNKRVVNILNALLV